MGEKYGSLHTSAKNSTVVLKMVDRSYDEDQNNSLLANGCVIRLSDGRFVFGATMVEKDPSGKKARSQATATLRALQTRAKKKKEKVPAQEGIGLGLFLVDQDGIKLILTKLQSVSESVAQIALRTLGSTHKDLSCIKQIIVGKGDRKALLEGRRSLSDFSLEDLKRLLEDAGMEDPEEREQHAALFQQEPDEVVNLDALMDAENVALEEMQKALDRQQALVERFSQTPESSTNERMQIITELLEIESFGSDLPVVGKISKATNILISHAHFTFAQPQDAADDSVFDDLNALLF